MKSNPLLVAILVLAASLGGGSAVAQSSLFNESFEVTKSQWYRGEPVQLRHTLCNATGSRLDLSCGSPCPRIGDVVIKDSQDRQIAQYIAGGCPAVCVHESWEADECRSVTLKWPQVTGQFPHPGDGVPVEPGTYYAETVFDDPPLRTGNFQILAASLPIPVLGGAAVTILLAFLAVAGSYVLRQRRA